jgi:endonuclease YncB( thermonuclease family)
MKDESLSIVMAALFAMAASVPGEEKDSGNGEPNAKIDRTLVTGESRFPGDKLVRLRGKAKVIDAHTLRFEDGTEVDLNGTIDVPDMEQKALIGEKLYPCGQEAAQLIRKLIGEQTVTCYIDTRKIDEKKFRGAQAFVGEMHLNAELVRNGWGMAHHSGMAAWEAVAREHKRGLWRGPFVFPERWRKGERLPEEK